MFMIFAQMKMVRTFYGNNKTGRKFDIGIIGDSFTEGIGLNYENSFAGLIEKN